MGFGAALAFVAVGAILAFAVKWDVPGIDLQLIGWIFMGVGVVAGVITRLYTRTPREEAVEVVEPDILYTTDPAPAHGVEPHVHTRAAEPHVHVRAADPAHGTEAVHRVAHVDEPRREDEPTRSHIRPDGPV